MNKTGLIIFKQKWLTGGFILMLLVILILRLFINHTSKSEYVVEHIERVVNRKFTAMGVLMDEIVVQLSSDRLASVNNIKQLFYDASIYKQNTEVYIFETETLLFWNSNKNLIEASKIEDYSLLQFVRRDNGYYLVQFKSVHGFQILLLDLVYANYPIENSFVENGFHEGFGASAQSFSIVPASDKSFPVEASNGDVLFNIAINNGKTNSQLNERMALVFALFVGLLSFLYLILYKFYLAFSFLTKRKWLLIAAYTIDVLIIQLLVRFFADALFDAQNELFQPLKFSFGMLFPSLGILILHLHAVLFIAIIFVKELDFPYPKPRLMYNGVVLIIVSLLTQFVLISPILLAKNIFFHASVPLTFNEISVPNAWSIGIILAIGFIIVSSVLVAFRLTMIFFKHKVSFVTKTVIFLITLIFSIIISLNGSLALWMAISFVLLFYFICWYAFKLGQTQLEKPSLLLLLLVLYSIVFTALIFKVNQTKSDQEQMLTVQKLSIDTDPMFEYLFPEAINTIVTDSIIKSMVAAGNDAFQLDEQVIYERLKNKWTNGYFERYTVEQTLCSPHQQLLIQPENTTINCNQYFNELIAIKGQKSNVDGLYLIDDNIQGIYYLAVIPLKSNDTITVKNNEYTLYLEFYYKYIPEGLGYPELLIDEASGFTREFSNYSFATYQNGGLVYKFGSYLYPQQLENLSALGNMFFNYNSYRHIIQNAGQQKVLVVSKKNKSFTESFAPFSYIFILSFGLGLIVVLAMNHKKNQGKAAFSFRAKLQLLILSSLLLSFIIIGIGTTYYITDVYKSKNSDFLSEKTQSILIELEQKLKNKDLIKESNSGNLHQLLLKFSMIFFSDINIYDLSGRLLASSRQEIFNRGLISSLMNSVAYREMHHENKLLFLHQEQIGKGKYLSSYIPFKDSQGNTSAYINLPYFAKESEMRGEISSLVMAYINIFLLLTGISVAMALLLSRRLTQPLQMIQKKMSVVRIDKINEKIVWKGSDEIGQLVAQYNTLLDQLQHSAELLSRSERESAWREMARQVAHEIKNPLTPMRLSVQYLLKAWNEKDENIDEKLRNTTITLINQIDTLSSIASAFSDFAKMPVNKPTQINLSAIVKETLDLFKYHENIFFHFVDETNNQAEVFADPDNMSRVFTNLLNNSVQAIGNKANGEIKVLLTRHENTINIDISDNGKGMSADEEVKAFTPNFTTKSSGMGIGLSIVYNLISASDGTITFETVQGKGTIFHIVLPVYLARK